MTTVPVPHSDVDLFADDVLTNPYPTFAELREAGPVVWLPNLGVYALPRYAEVRQVLSDHVTFISGQGIAFNDLSNEATSTNIVASDPPIHDTLRNVLAARLSPRALRQLRTDIERQADELVDEVVGRGSFDVVRDLARPFPLQVVADLIGLPAEGRDEVLEWAEGAFNAAGPLNERAERGLVQLQQQFTYIASFASRDKLAPRSMGAAVYEAADRGEIDEAASMSLMSAYLTAGMDTTINTIGHAVWLFAQHPDQWTRLREDPSIIPNAFSEVLRVESPVYASGRVLSADHDTGGVVIPKGARVALLYGSANRDERKWTDPDRFDVARDAVDHLAFGYGIHSCAGQGLARLEAHGIFAALARRVEHFEAGEPVRKLNNTVRGLGSLPVTVRRAVGA